jgi:hypothetical protein
MCEDGRIGHIGIRSANPFTLDNFYWLSADQHKQIDIRRGARSHQLRGGFVKQNEIFEISQKLKGQSEKFKNQ